MDKLLHICLTHFVLCTSFFLLSPFYLAVVGNLFIRGDPVAQLVVTSTADAGVTNSILAWSHTFVEIDHEKNSMAIHLPLLIQEGLRKYVHNVLIKRLVRLAQEKSVVR